MTRASPWDDAHGRSLSFTLVTPERRGGPWRQAASAPQVPGRSSQPSLLSLLQGLQSSPGYLQTFGQGPCEAVKAGGAGRPGGRRAVSGRSSSLDHAGQGRELGCPEWGFWKAEALESPSRAQAGKKARERTSWFTRAQA